MISAPTHHVPIDDLRLGDLPARAAALWGDRPALYYGESHVETHAEFAANVDRVAKGLVALGVESGDHVAVWMTNRPAWLHLLYAVPMVGGCLVPLNTRYRSDDMAFTAINSESRWLITIDRSGPIDYAELLRDGRAEIEAAGHLQGIVLLATEGTAPAALVPSGAEASVDVMVWEDMLAAGEGVSDGTLAERSDAIDVDQLMMLAYTSGTTGNPKGVMHTHRPIRNVRERTMLLGHHKGDVHLNFLPLFHIYAVSEISMMVSITGSAQVLFEAFDPDEALDAIERLAASVVHGFDSHWGDLLTAQAAKQRDVASLRIGSLPAGMRSTVPIAREVQQVFCPTISGFGLSESWAFICCSHPSHTEEQRIEASGYPMDGVEVEVRDPETGEVLPPDTRGQLYLRYYTITPGYWANTEATAETIDDGWLNTGDMGTIRADGHLVFIGRYKDMLKVGGENMSPAEVEGYLLDVPGVAEVAVVGFPDERLAEVPVAYVVRSKDAGEELVSEEGLIAGLQGRIASYKIPRAVVFIDEMPMTPSGKIRKIELRARALDDLAPKP